jgi:AraC family transcriptional regulator
VTSEFDRIVLDSGSARLGLWRCPAGHPRFEDTGPIEGYLLVFPGTRVSITHAGKAPIRADPTLVLFYNRGQEYRRGRISPEGDFCQWIAVPPEWVVEAVRPFEPRVDERPLRPFGLTHGPSSSSSFLRQLILIRLAQRRTGEDVIPDPLAVEEAVVSILAASIASAYAARRMDALGSGRGSARAGSELVDRVRDVLARSYTESLTLAAVARTAGTSPFHMCRVFRRVTGRTLHSYRNTLRLRRALELVAQGQPDLTTLALDLGYSSHSHFTHSFRTAYGVTPAFVRRNLSVGTMRELSTILTA